MLIIKKVQKNIDTYQFLKCRYSSFLTATWTTFFFTNSCDHVDNPSADLSKSDINDSFYHGMHNCYETSLEQMMCT